MNLINKYPKDFVKNRDTLEGNFIMCLYKEPDLFGDYMNNISADKDFLTEEGRFYYAMGREMFKLGYNSFDDATIYAFIENRDSLKDTYEGYGGYQPIKDMKRILDTDNVEAYYDELIKWNMVLQLHDKGFNVSDNLHKLKQMSLTEVYSFYEYQLDNVFLNRGAGVKIEDLDITKDFIESCDEGMEMGLNYGKAAPILNYHTLGLHKSNVQIFGGFSGTGKTSFCINTYVIPILDQGESVTIVANEMNKRAWQHIFLATILSQKLNYYGLPRKKQKMGNLNEEQKEMMYKAKKYYEENYKGRIKFAKIYDYSVDDVKRIIRKMSKRGHGYYLYDTFKAEDASSSTVTGELIEASKQLLQVAEKEDVSIIITMQLAIYMENTRYLTSATLSNAKGVKEVVSELVLTRPLWEDEMQESDKYYIAPFKYKRDSEGKFTKIKETIELNPDKKYRIMFLDKTRNDEGDIAILFQFDGAWNKWTELGYCTPKHQR